MRSARTSLTLMKRDERVGLLLWARSRFAIPTTLSRTFVGAEKIEDVPLWVPSKEGLEEKPVRGWWLPAREAALVLCHDNPAGVYVLLQAVQVALCIPIEQHSLHVGVPVAFAVAR